MRTHRNELKARKAALALRVQYISAITNEVITAASPFVDVSAPSVYDAVQELIASAISVRVRRVRGKVGIIYLKGSGPTMYPTTIQSATSVKPGNVRFNLASLAVAASEAVPTIYEAWQHPWLAPFAILVGSVKLRQLIKVHVEPLHAIMLLAMWGHADTDRLVNTDGLLEAVNTELRRHGFPDLAHDQMQHGLELLEEIKAIRPVPGSVSGWVVQEEIIL